MSNPVWLIVFASMVALLPIVIGLLTSYIKISVVLGMLRSGLGTQQVPSGMVVMVLSLAMTLYIMSPVLEQSATIAMQMTPPRLDRTPNMEELMRFSVIVEPWREFMQKNAGRQEIEVLRALADKGEDPEDASQAAVQQEKESGVRVLIPAFVLSEIKEGFAMGFVLLLPFLVIDLIVANILAGMGMYMVSPVMISLPLKLVLFVVSDGWILLTKGLVNSY